MKSIYDLALGESAGIGDSNYATGYDHHLIRVPGGWVMKDVRHDRGVAVAMCFIPFNTEFMENKLPTKKIEAELL